MPNWKKLIVSGSDASLNSLNVTNNVTAQSFTGSFSGSFNAPGATTQVIYNNGGVLAASSNFVFSGTNVGIGTTTPATVLHTVGSNIVNIVESTSSVSYTQYYNSSTGTGGTSDGLTVGVNGTSGVIYLRENADLFFGTADTERMRITSTGNVGIGTSTPTSKLDVIGNSYISGSLSVKTTSTAGTGLTVGGSTVLLSFAEIQQGNALYLFSSGNTYYSTISQVSQNLILTPDTNVGIGTTSPSYKLDVSGSIRTQDGYILGANSLADITIDGNIGSQLRYGTQKFTLNSSNASISTNNTTRLFVNNAGDIGIGNTSPAATLEVTGNVKAVSFTGSLSGSATNAVSASYALTSSYASFAQTAGAASTATSASYALTASYAVTASHALTASYVNPLNQDLILTGSFIATGGVTASNALINGNLTVIGTASFTYTTASYVNVGASTITLNTDNPAVRFGGINVVDSGSFGTSSTGSLLWDSEKNRWIYSNPSGSTYDGGLLISGPRNTTGLGNEQGTTLNALMKGQGGDHITSSGVFEVSGNVGVGTSSPSYKLDVVGSARLTDSAAQLILDNATYSELNYGTSNYFRANGGQAIINGPNIAFLTGGTEKVRIDTTGNVGIGTTSPVSKLETYDGDISVTTANSFSYLNNNRNFIPNSSGVSLGALRYRGYSTGTTYQVGTGIWSFSSLGWNSTSTPAYLSFQTTPSGSVTPTEKMVITSEGLVGIGLTSPNSTLHLYGGGDQYLTIQSSTTGASTSAFTKYIRSTTGSARTWWTGVGIQGGSDDSYSFYDQTAAAERMRILSNGNVGIGTTSPESKLHVSGGPITLKGGNSTDQQIVFNYVREYVQGIYNSSGHFRLQDNSLAGTVYQWDGSTFAFPNGNVGIGTTSPTAKLEVNGNVKATSFTGSFSGSVSAPGSTTQIVYNDNGILAANSGLVYSGSNVGIGISSPTDKLHIVSSATGNQFGRITATDSNSSAAWVAQNDSGDNVVYRVFSSGVSGTQMGNALGRSASLLANLGGSGVFLLGTFSNTDFILGTNNTENMRITTAGNVGIGTSSPQTGFKLDVNGSTVTRGEIYSNSDIIGFGANENYKIAESGNTWLAKTTGAVGIGTSSPSARLHISGSTDATQRIIVDGSGNNSSLHLNYNGSNVGFINSYQNSELNIGTSVSAFVNLYTNNTERMRITAAGNVGIGTTSPTKRLHVRDTASPYQINLQSDTSKVWAAGVGISGYYQDWFLLSDGTSDIFRINAGYTEITNNIYASANIGIGTASPSQKLEVQGQAQIGNDSVTSAGLFFARRNTNQAKSHYFLSAQESPTYQWIEGGYFTSELAGVSVANNSGKPYYESYSPAGQNKSFGFINQTTSGSSFTSTAATASMTLFQGGNIALAYNGGNVGIGTSSPNSILEISQPTPIVRIESSDVNQFHGIEFRNGGNLDAFIKQLPQTGEFKISNGRSVGWGGHITLYTDTVERMRITSAGNVGIGTSSPGELLEVVGNIRANVSNGGGFMLTGASASGLVRAGATGLALRTNTTDRLTVDNSGNVGIGTTSPVYALDVVSSAANNSARFRNSAGGDTLVSIIAGNYNTEIDARLFIGEADTYGMTFEYDGSTNIGYIGMNDNINPTGSYSKRIQMSRGGTEVAFMAGNIGIGTSSPGYKLEVVGAVSASTYYGDGSNLTNIGSGSISAAGSDGQLQYNNSGLFGGASRLYYNDSTNRVGIGTSSPGYDLDVSGSVRAQDRLRVGPVNSGNGVVHQSSDATINPTSATVVWTVSGTAGICAFIEYYLLNSNTGTSQRAGNIVTTWNAAGTPQITHTETSTPDVGSTTPVTFSTSLTLGGDPQLIATNSGGDSWYMIMNYRYF